MKTFLMFLVTSVSLQASPLLECVSKLGSNEYDIYAVKACVEFLYTKIDETTIDKKCVLESKQWVFDMVKAHGKDQEGDIKVAVAIHCGNFYASR